MAKKRVGKFPKAFRQMAVDRLNQCENIVTLAKELGVSRRLLYTWRDKLERHHQRGIRLQQQRRSEEHHALNHQVCSFLCLTGGVHPITVCSNCAQLHLIPTHPSLLQPKWTSPDSLDTTG